MNEYCWFNNPGSYVKSNDSVCIKTRKLKVQVHRTRPLAVLLDCCFISLSHSMITILAAFSISLLKSCSLVFLFQYLDNREYYAGKNSSALSLNTLLNYMAGRIF